MPYTVLSHQALVVTANGHMSAQCSDSQNDKATSISVESHTDIYSRWDASWCLQSILAAVLLRNPAASLHTCTLRK